MVWFDACAYDLPPEQEDSAVIKHSQPRTKWAVVSPKIGFTYRYGLKARLQVQTQCLRHILCSQLL